MQALTLQAARAGKAKAKLGVSFTEKVKRFGMAGL